MGGVLLLLEATNQSFPTPCYLEASQIVSNDTLLPYFLSSLGRLRQLASLFTLPTWLPLRLCFQSSLPSLIFSLQERQKESACEPPLGGAPSQSSSCSRLLPRGRGRQRRGRGQQKPWAALMLLRRLRPTHGAALRGRQAQLTASRLPARGHTCDPHRAP